MKNLITVYDTENLVDRYTIALNLPSGTRLLSLLFKDEREPTYPLGKAIDFQELPGHIKLDILRYIKFISE
jgi:hypothetical protein